MSNRENFPASLFPLRGDISAEAGDVTVRVQGVQGIPVTAAVPTGGKSLTYNSDLNEIDWGVGNSALLINGAGVSPDKRIFINGVFDGSAPTWVVQVNGVSDGG